MAEFSVVGQSNSIMHDGFVQRIIDAGHHTMRASGRIGASPSILAPFFMEQPFVTSSDYCIIDMCVVDAAAMHNNAIDPLNITDYLRSLVHACRRNGCQPVILIIPPLSLFGGSYAERYFYAIYESVIRSMNCFYLDLRELMNGLAKKNSVSIPSLYKDPSHIGAEVSEAAAKLMVKFLDAKEHRYREAPVEYLKRNFRRMSVGSIAPPALCRVFYKNSLIEFSGIRLARGQQLTIQTGPIQRLHGALINSANSFCKVSMAGNIQIVKNLNLRPYSPTATFEARLVPICTPLADARGEIVISICDDQAETNDPTMQESLEFSGQPAHVEMAEVLVEDSQRLEAYVAKIPVLGSTNLYSLREA